MIFFLEIPCFFLFFGPLFYFIIYVCTVVLQEYVSISAFIVVFHG